MDTEPVLAAARARGLEIGALLESHGYFEAWAVGEALVMRIPRVHVQRPLARGVGPVFVKQQDVFGVDAKSAAVLFEGSLERQRKATAPQLPRFLDVIELAGTNVSLFERPPGAPLTAIEGAKVRPYLPRLVAALAGLHEAFGFHGDLSPAHICFDGEQFTFSDPLAPGDALGTMGYALPISGHTPEHAAMRDLAALASVVAEVQGVWLFFDAKIFRLLEGMQAWNMGMEIGHHRLSHEIRETVDSIRTLALPLDESARSWLTSTCERALDAIMDDPPPGTSVRWLRGGG